MDENRPVCNSAVRLGRRWAGVEDRRIGGFPGWIPLCFSPDGVWLATGAIEPRTLQVTNLVNGRNWATRLDGTQDRVDAVSFSPDARLLAACCEGELALFEVSSGRYLSTLTRWTNATPINALAITPDGKTLVVGRFSPRVELWDLRGRKLIAESPGHLAQVMSLAISPDGKTLSAPANQDREGMPDDWEMAHGLNPTDLSDGHAEPKGDGYTNLEEYLTTFCASQKSL